MLDHFHKGYGQDEKSLDEERVLDIEHNTNNETDEQDDTDEEFTKNSQCLTSVERKCAKLHYCIHIAKCICKKMYKKE